MDDFLTTILYVLLGLLQGLTEPLPISSSGHMVLFQRLTGMEDYGLFFENLLHIASLIAIVVILRKRIVELARGTFRYIFLRDRAYATAFHDVLKILLAAVPIGIVGFTLGPYIDGFTPLWSVGAGLFVTAAFLLLVQRASTVNTKEHVGLLDAVVIGLAQVAALLPGISRSGSTFVGGLSRKLDFKKTIEFSFLLYIPVTLGVTIYEMWFAERVIDVAIPTIVLSFVASAFMTYFAFRFFVGMVAKGRLKVFAYYCFAAGAFALIAHFVI